MADTTQRPGATITGRSAPGSPGGEPALIARFAERADRHGGELALRAKRRGIWQERTWGAVRDQVAHLALGLTQLGVGPSDRVAVMGRPTAEWLITDLATQSLGAVTVGLFVTTAHDEVARQLRVSGARVFVAESLEYVDGLLEAERLSGGDRLADHILVASERGLAGRIDPRVRSLAEVQASGETVASGDLSAWRAMVGERSADEPVRLFFTAGTTGSPRPVLLDTTSLVEVWAAYFSSLPTPPGPKDRTVSFLPMAHIGETVFTVVLPILYGTVPHFPEDEDTVGEALIEVSPTVLLAFPRLLDLYASNALVDLDTGSAAKRRICALAAKVGGPIAHHGVFRHLLNKFGFQKVRIGLVGGSAVSPAVLALWRRWGLELSPFYGLTEAGGLAAVGSPGRDVLTAAPGVELRLADDGELLVRSAAVAGGGDVEIDADGWLHTGDVGEARDGGIAVLDRRQDVLDVGHGAPAFPSEIENALTFGPYIQDAMVVSLGDRLGALVGLNLDNVALWARDHKILFTSSQDLIGDPRVGELIAQAVEEANRRLTGAGSRHTVADHRILPSAIGSGMSPIGTIRRRVLAAEHAALIDGMAAARS